MLADLHEALTRDAAAAGDVLQKGDDLLVPFGAAEGEDEEGVEIQFSHETEPINLKVENSIR